MENNTKRTKANGVNISALQGYMERVETQIQNLHDNFHKVSASLCITSNEELSACFPLKTVEEVLDWPNKDPNLTKFTTR